MSPQKDGALRYQRLLPIVLVLALAAIFFINHTFFPPPMLRVQDRRPMMDTWVEITVYDRSQQVAEAAIDAAFLRMEDVERIASIHVEGADAFRLNDQGRLDDPSLELVEIIEAAKEYYALTAGTFDITVEPLLDLWRHREGAEVQFWELNPDVQQGAIDEALALVGADRIRIISDPHRSILLQPGMKITLGGIAKGYIVDQGLSSLRQAGIVHAMINAGGDIGVFGGKPMGEKWVLALRDPADHEAFLVRFVLKEGAVATSGNYERYFDREARVGHIIDPRTGRSARASSSASVVAGTGMEADALATAVFILGPIAGIDLVHAIPGVEVLVVGYDEPQRIYRSDGLGVFTEENGGI
ncbi:FAD:protein FMN transferase [Candidatus Bipolaricaulota bacterium]|nr:FAD:protein FMN transferase [Candidatus Bipolaricaulota bacterium]